MQDTLIGSRLGRYQIAEAIRKSDLIGVYKAFDTKLERTVLMKLVLHARDYSHDSIEYFLNESKSLAKLSHPHITKVLDFGHEDRNLYLITEYITGKNLSELMNGPMNWHTVVDILAALADALAYAHSKGVIHRDLKPDNIIINNDGQPVVSDFSLIRIIEDEETRDMTGTMVGLGSAGYISPEQGKGLPADFRSDIYSLGVIFFEMITGKKPFNAVSSMEMVIQHVMVAPPRPRSIIPNLPRGIEEIILTALSKDVSRRYQTMQEFADALKSVKQPDDGNENRLLFGIPRRLSISVLVFLAIGLTAVWLWSSSRQAQAGVATLTQQAIGTASAIQPEQTETPSVNLTSQPLSTSAEIIATPTSQLDLPVIPVLPGTPLPAGASEINQDNIENLVELARWGYPQIDQISFAMDDQLLLAATGAGIYYLNPEDLSSSHFFDTRGMLTTLSVSADGEWVATGDISGNVTIWNLRDGKEIDRLEGVAGRIKSLEFSPDKSKVVFSDVNKTIHVWDLDGDIHTPFEKKHTLNINRIIFSPDGDFVISGGDDFQIYIWNIRSGQAARNIAASQKINDLALSADGTRLALALNNAVIEVWDLQKGERISSVKDSKIIHPYTHIKFLSTNDIVLAGSADGSVRLWNVSAVGRLWESPIKTREGRPNELDPIRSLAISRNGSRFAIAYVSGLVELWDLSRQSMEISKSSGHRPIRHVVISPNDQTLVYEGNDSIIDILSFTNGARRKQLSGTLPRGELISPDNRTILIHSGSLYLYPLTSAGGDHLFEFFDVPPNGTVSFSPDGKLVYSFSNGVLKYWTTSSGLELSPKSMKNQGNCRVIIRQDESFLVAASVNGILSSDANLDHFCRVSRGPRTISENFLADGSIIALSLQNHLLDLWDLRNAGQKVVIDSVTAKEMLDVSISNDGNLLAAASAGGIIEIYDLNTRNLIRSLDLHTSAIHQVVFSNDRKYLIAGLADGTLRIYGIHP